jgi:hypothetical protein
MKVIIHSKSQTFASVFKIVIAIIGAIAQVSH